MEGAGDGAEACLACEVAARVDEGHFDLFGCDCGAGGCFDDVGVDAFDHEYPSVLALGLELVWNHRCNV